MPVTVALTSDYSPLKRRGTLIMLMFCGNNAGRLSRRPACRANPSRFRLAKHLPRRGIPPAGVDPVLMIFLPESPRFLIAHRADAPATQAILRKLNVSAQAAASKLVDVAEGNPSGNCSREPRRGNDPALGGFLRQPPEYVSV